MKLNSWLNIWLNTYQKPSIKLRTYIRYNEIINKHINPILGEYDLNDLNHTILQNFVIHKLNYGNLITHNSLSTNSVILIVSLLKQALKEAKKLSLINYDESNLIKLPSISEKEISVFTKYEQNALESYCLNSKPNYIGIIICLYTGIRLGELLALTWDDINFEKRLLSINKTVCVLSLNGKATLHVDKPKTSRSLRVIPLPKQLVILLKENKKTSSSKYIICTKKGGIVNNRSYQKTFKSILNKCRIPYRNFHSLRHTFATRALELGLDVKTLSEILGHKNPNITLNRYAHSLLEHKIYFMNKL